MKQPSDHPIEHSPAASSVRKNLIHGHSDSGRVPELDGLRGVAILLVLVFHANQAWLPWGWAGVDLFFVLSGYLITTIILKNGASPGFLRQFYARRSLRTWPTYYLFIGILALLSPLLARPFFWSALPWVLTYTQNISGLWSGTATKFTAYAAHTWTLAIEEQFYLVWPILVLGMGRRFVPLSALVCVCASVLARGQGVWFQSLIAQMDGLAMGGWLAAMRVDAGWSWAKPGRVGRWQSWVPVAASFLALLTLAWNVGVSSSRGLATHPGVLVFSFNVFWMFLLNLVLNSAGRPELAWLRFAPLVKLGAISYGVYLYHYPMAVIAHDLSDALHCWTQLNLFRLVAVILSIPVAALSWRYIEQPILALKSRFAYEKTKHPQEPHKPRAKIRQPNATIGTARTRIKRTTIP